MESRVNSLGSHGRHYLKTHPGDIERKTNLPGVEVETYQARKTPDTWSWSLGCDLVGHSSNQEVHQAQVSSEGHSCAGGNESVTGAVVWVALSHNHASSTTENKQIKSQEKYSLLLVIWLTATLNCLQHHTKSFYFIC